MAPAAIGGNVCGSNAPLLNVCGADGAIINTLLLGGADVHNGIGHGRIELVNDPNFAGLPLGRDQP